MYLAQGHNTAEVGLEPLTSRSGVCGSTTRPPRSPSVNESLTDIAYFKQPAPVSDDKQSGSNDNIAEKSILTQLSLAVVA